MIQKVAVTLPSSGRLLGVGFGLRLGTRRLEGDRDGIWMDKRRYLQCSELTSSRLEAVTIYVGMRVDQYFIRQRKGNQ